MDRSAWNRPNPLVGALAGFLSALFFQVFGTVPTRYGSGENSLYTEFAGVLFGVHPAVGYADMTAVGFAVASAFWLAHRRFRSK